MKTKRLDPDRFIKPSRYRTGFKHGVLCILMAQLAFAIVVLFLRALK